MRKKRKLRENREQNKTNFVRKMVKVNLVTRHKSVVQFDSTEHSIVYLKTTAFSCSNTRSMVFTAPPGRTAY